MDSAATERERALEQRVKELERENALLKTTPPALPTPTAAPAGGWAMRCRYSHFGCNVVRRRAGGHPCAPAWAWRSRTGGGAGLDAAAAAAAGAQAPGLSGVAAAADHTCQNSVLRSEFTSAERSLTFYCASSCRLADPALFPCVGWRRRA